MKRQASGGRASAVSQPTAVTTDEGAVALAPVASRALLNRADLLRALSSPNPAGARQVAQQLGLELPQLPKRPDEPALSRGEADVAEASSVESREPEPQRSEEAFFVRMESVEFADEPIQLPEAIEQPAPRPIAPELPTSPMCTWPRLWRRLRPALQRTRISSELDVDQAVARLSRAEFMQRYPRKQRRVMPRRVQVIIDRDVKLIPMWADQDFAARQLRRVLGRQRVEEYWLEAGAPPARAGFGLGSGQTSLVLSDLGALHSGVAAQEWCQAIRALCTQGPGPVLLSPVHRVAGVGPSACLPWDLSGAERQRAKTLVERLLVLVSPAIRVEPGLLREVRRQCLKTAGVHTELLAWNHPHVLGTWSVAMAILPEHLQHCRSQFLELPMAEQQRALELLHEWHESLWEEIWYEELLSMWALALERGRRLPVPPSWIDAARAYFEWASQEEVVKADALDDGKPAWIRRYRQRVPDALYQQDAALNDRLLMAWAIAHREQPSARPPPGLTAAHLAALSQGRSATRLRLWQRGDELIVTPQDGAPQDGGDSVGSPLGEIEAANLSAYVARHEAGEGESQAEQWKLDTPYHLVSWPQRLTITTDRGKWTFVKRQKPDWAVAMGQDRHGSFFDITFRMGDDRTWRPRIRWIGPGQRFLSTLPAASDESRVRIGRGFWLSEQPAAVEPSSLPPRADVVFAQPSEEQLLYACTPAPDEESLNQWGLQVERHEQQGLSSGYVRLTVVEASGSESLLDSLVDVLPDASWADRSGRDRYGLYADIEIAGVTQRLRWVAPGSFLMGSPEDEPERHDDETQHEVQLTRGFWLADTACTQDLWQAVMAANPSRFEGAQRPVDSVSWDDCQRFLKRVNERRPELALRLPTEAEWEYACRAGTSSPFSFGETITTEQVNYDGNLPYAGAAEGQYRERTVEVKELPANPSGLYQMHGNVWEWCADWRAAYPPGRSVDPKGPPDGSERVLRGGSWIDYARHARSAYRIAFRPEYRYDRFGLRFARGQE